MHATGRRADDVQLLPGGDQHLGDIGAVDNDDGGDGEDGSAGTDGQSGVRDYTGGGFTGDAAAWVAVARDAETPDAADCAAGGNGAGSEHGMHDTGNAGDAGESDEWWRWNAAGDAVAVDYDFGD